MRTAITFLLTLLAASVCAQNGTWEQLPFEADEVITAVSCLNEDTAYLVTQGGLIGRTTDAGSSWQARTLVDGMIPEDLQVIDNRRVIICGRNGLVLRTVDGGSNWIDLSLEDTTVWLLSIAMFDKDIGVMVGIRKERGKPPLSTRFRTVDGGLSWTEQEFEDVGCSRLCIEDNRQIHFATLARLYTSSDLGESWRTRKLDLQTPGRGLAMRGHWGVLVGNEALAAASPDSGNTWHQTELTHDNNMTSVLIVNDTLAFMAGYLKTVYMTTDGGVNWTLTELPFETDILDLDAARATVLAVGTHGAIFRYRF